MGIIMLTANSDAVDRIVGFEVGANDYVTKPFDPRELLARVRSVLRRISQTGRVTAATMGAQVQVGTCRLNLGNCKVVCPDGTEVPLTSMEFHLLKVFVQYPNRVLTARSASRPDAWQRGGSLRQVHRHAECSRSLKVKIDLSVPLAIKTIRGRRYMFVPAT